MDYLFRYKLDYDHPEFRSPKHSYPLVRMIRDLLRETEIWDQELDHFLERALSRRRYSRYKANELESITRGLMQEFTHHIDRNIEKSSSKLSDQLSNVNKHSKQLTDQIEIFKKNQEEQAKKITKNEEDISTNKGELHDFFWLSSVGIDFKNAKIKRYLPARIYVSDPVPRPDILNNITNKLINFAELLDLEKTDDFPEERGSWWKRFFFKTKEVLSQDEVLDRVDSAEKALKLKHLDKPQAEANKMQAEAASQLISSLKDIPAACIQVGSLLVVKAPNNNGESAIFTRTLSHNELKQLEENQSILGKPGQILDWLQNCRDREELPALEQ